jgi:DNA polymerase-4
LRRLLCLGRKARQPDLRDKPVIIGGGRRGVVSTACYIARIKGVRSAMPMFKALQALPRGGGGEARMEVYAEVSRQDPRDDGGADAGGRAAVARRGVLDLTGTARLHGAPPAVMLARLVRRMKDELGHHRLHRAQPQQVPRQGRLRSRQAARLFGDRPGETGLPARQARCADLGRRPGHAQEALERAGIRTFADLLRWDQRDLTRAFGSMGERLWHLARGEDRAGLGRNAPVKSISNETTFHEDTADPTCSTAISGGWPKRSRTAPRPRARRPGGHAEAQARQPRDPDPAAALREPTQIADRIYRTARELYDAAAMPGRSG